MLIEREEVLDKLASVVRYGGGIARAINLIEEIPEAVEPRKWIIKYTEFRIPVFVCPRCNGESYKATEYCPKCGSHMLTTSEYSECP